MVARLALALHAGIRTALAVLLVQAAVAAALAAALPDVGHVHPVGTGDHAHGLFEVGGLAVPPEPRMQAPRPLAVVTATPLRQARAPRPSGPRRTRWGRAPPAGGASRPALLRAT